MNNEKTEFEKETERLNQTVNEDVDVWLEEASKDVSPQQSRPIEPRPPVA